MLSSWGHGYMDGFGNHVIQDMAMIIPSPLRLPQSHHPKEGDGITYLGPTTTKVFHMGDGISSIKNHVGGFPK